MHAAAVRRQHAAPRGTLSAHIGVLGEGAALLETAACDAAARSNELRAHVRALRDATADADRLSRHAAEVRRSALAIDALCTKYAEKKRKQAP